MKAQQIALSVDVWDILKKHLPNEFLETDILSVQFKYDLTIDQEKSKINLATTSDKGAIAKKVELGRYETEKLIEELCNKFNIPFENMCSLKFGLEPKDIPIFKVNLYPFVNDTSELNMSRIKKVNTVN